MVFCRWYKEMHLSISEMIIRFRRNYKNEWHLYMCVCVWEMTRKIYLSIGDILTILQTNEVQ